MEACTTSVGKERMGTKTLFPHGEAIKRGSLTNARIIHEGVDEEHEQTSKPNLLWTGVKRCHLTTPRCLCGGYCTVEINRNRE